MDQWSFKVFQNQVVLIKHCMAYCYKSRIQMTPMFHLYSPTLSFVQWIIEEVCGPEGYKITSHLAYMLVNLHGGQLVNYHQIS